MGDLLYTASDSLSCFIFAYNKYYDIVEDDAYCFLCLQSFTFHCCRRNIVDILLKFSIFNFFDRFFLLIESTDHSKNNVRFRITSSRLYILRDRKMRFKLYAGKTENIFAQGFPKILRLFFFEFFISRFQVITKVSTGWSL